MKRQNILTADFRLKSFSAWDRQWLLLTAGENAPGKFNAMTVAWGSIGVMWAKPFVMVVVRPTRHTYGFMEGSSSFTLCAFPEQLRPALTLCGSKSGRDCDKVKEAGLTPIASLSIQAPGFDEAELIVECRKIYMDDVNPANFLADYIAPNYNKDYHRIYFGEVLAIHGTEKYAGA